MKKKVYLFIAASILGFTLTTEIVLGIDKVKFEALIDIKNKVSTIDLNAMVINNIGQVSWKAPLQKNICRYHLEKSTDAQNYSYVTAIAGNNKPAKKNYLVHDRALMEGNNYYRLKVIVANGSFYYSKVTVLNTKSSISVLKILPAVVNDQLQIWMTANTAISKAIISDAAGSIQLQHCTITNSAGIAAIEMSTLLPGFYTVKLFTNKGEIVTHKFMKK